MMQRKKHFDLDGKDSSQLLLVNDKRDDGGSSKQKSANQLLRGTLSSALFFLTNRISKLNGCFPGIPTAFKLIILSFIGFATIVVLTAKGRHEHWRYRHRMRSPHMPIPLMERLHERIRKDRGGTTKNGYFSKKGYFSHDQPMRLAHSSRFVDSEKKLKEQLKGLWENQTAEKKHGSLHNLENSILGVKISNRYLGDDLLPYPKSKGFEREWEKLMDLRKAELSKLDALEWKEILMNHYQAMQKYISDEKELQSTDQKLDDRTSVSLDHEKIEEPNLVQSLEGNSRWPPPTNKAGSGTTILLKPSFGVHRSDRDAIFAFAEGYDLPVYLALVQSLIDTGYSGDLVLSISREENLKPDVKEYLQSKNSDAGGINIVAYEVDWTCFKQSGEPTDGSGEGVNHCVMNDVFADVHGHPLPDPRDPRPVATARYELYWMWSLQYKNNSWLMLIDARDVWFQLNPFDDLSKRGEITGELHLFGENANAIKIGSSRFNRSWLITAYGEKAVLPYFEKPVICSGSTIGNQDAIETYLRAMVAEFDVTLCKSKGCDQGFHNFLFYSGKLGSIEDDSRAVEGISKVYVHEQGKGIINNLAALRVKPLSEWGLYDEKTELVLNWDGSTSVVAHQYDRDKAVNSMVKRKKREFESRWRNIKNSI